MLHTLPCEVGYVAFGGVGGGKCDTGFGKRTVFCKERGMRKVIHFVLMLALMLTALGARAQTVQDAGYRVVAHIKSDGTIQDASYRIIGHIKSDGTIQDESYRIVGHLKSDGTVQDASYRIVCHIKSDGTVQDSSYRIIGHVKSDGTVQDASYRVIGHTKGIPMRWAALYFFFR